MKLQTNDKIKNRKYSNTWRPNNILLNVAWITEDIGEDIKKLLGVNENDITTYQNLWKSVKAVLRGKCIACNETLLVRFIHITSLIRFININFTCSIGQNVLIGVDLSISTNGIRLVENPLVEIHQNRFVRVD